MSSLDLLPPSFGVPAVADAISRQYGISGDYRQLVSERDQNFCLRVDGVPSYVVKVTHAGEDPVVTDFQIAALLHLEEQGLLGVPRVVRTLDGRCRGEIDGDERYSLRVVTWLAGDLLSSKPMTAELAADFGDKLAQLDLALEGFSHAGDSQVLLWDSQRAAELRQYLVHVDDSNVRRAVDATLDDFERRVQPALPNLPRQVIHNDANDDNVLLGTDNTIAGFIDFGDMLLASRVIEVATAASYLRVSGDPLQDILPFVQGYCSRNPLNAAETDVLFDLIRTRLTMTLVILYWRLSARDESDPYRQKALAVNHNALQFLENLSQIGRDEFRRRVAAKKS